MAVSDAKYVNRRRTFLKFGPATFAICLALIAGLGVWIFLNQPLLINYVEVARRIEDNRIDPLTVELMAVMLPIAMLMCLVLLAAIIALSWVGLSNERRYQRIIDSLAG